MIGRQHVRLEKSDNAIHRCLLRECKYWHRRYADATVPLDEALVRVVLDVSGRPFLSWHADIPRWQMLGDYDVFLTPEFFRAVVLNAGLTVHLDLLRGENPHHIVEATFKAFARALEAATRRDPRVTGIPST